MNNRLQEIYTKLHDHFGPQYWWPGDTPFEIMIGAVLTQNTNWNNVSRAIDNLKDFNLLSFADLENLPLEVLAQHIRPSGYFNQKAIRLKNLLRLIRETHDGNLDAFFSQSTMDLRERLLTVKGIGPETADSIVLYAAQKPIFVVDAYTFRILSRHNLVEDGIDYHELQSLFMDGLAEDVSLFNEYHALLVKLGKEFCKKSKPLCATCPLENF
jgi:endonuclease-3 related protein